MRLRSKLTRRAFVAGTAATTVTAAIPARVFGQVAGRPELPYGVQSGDVTPNSAVIWGAADRPARMLVEWSPTESFKDPIGAPIADAIPETGLAAKAALTDLPSGTDIFYRVTFANMDDQSLTSEPIIGRLRTAPTDRRSVSFVFGGDTAGQGWGINLDWGGMRTYQPCGSSTPISSSTAAT